MTTDIDDYVSCEECEALNPPELKFCEECGASLGRRQPPKGGVRRRTKGARGVALDREERKDVQQSFNRARKRLRVMRAFIWMGFLFNTLGALTFFLAGVTFVGWILAGMALLELLVALTIFIFPFGWTLALASFETLVVALLLLNGGMPVVKIVWAVMLWCTVPLMARVARVLRENGDEFDSAQLKGGIKTDAGRSDARARVEARRRAERKRSLQMKGAIFGGFLGVALIAFAGHHVLTTPRNLKPRLEAWRTAFEAGDFDAAEAICAPKIRGEFWAKAEGVLEREGWLANGVVLGDPQVIKERETYTEVHYALPRGILRCKWVVLDREWFVERVRFKNVKAQESE